MIPSIANITMAINIIIIDKSINIKLGYVIFWNTIELTDVKYSKKFENFLCSI